jgi:hypothetical protein
MSFPKARRRTREVARRHAEDHPVTHMLKLDCWVANCSHKGVFTPDVDNDGTTNVYCENRAHWAKPMVIVDRVPVPPQR